MRIAGVFSFNGGAEAVQRKYPHLLSDIENAISMVNAEDHRIKASREKTMRDRLLYSPISLNRAFKQEFNALGWVNRKVVCEYSTQYYTSDYQAETRQMVAFRDMDFVKERLGVEVQFGKYAFMVYNVCAKMTIFRNLGIIDTGVEIVPIKQFVDEMSTGVSYFEQFVWDLEMRGVADIDVPVLILGIDA